MSQDPVWFKILFLVSGTKIFSLSIIRESSCKTPRALAQTTSMQTGIWSFYSSSNQVLVESLRKCIKQIDFWKNLRCNSSVYLSGSCIIIIKVVSLLISFQRTNCRMNVDVICRVRHLKSFILNEPDNFYRHPLLEKTFKSRFSNKWSTAASPSMIHHKLNVFSRITVDGDDFGFMKTYVATQGCLPSTRADFWQMVWQVN